MRYDDPLWQQVENDPEILALKAKMREVEQQLRAAVPDGTWAIFLEWEALWAQYLTLYVERLYPLVYEKGRVSQLEKK